MLMKVPLFLSGTVLNMLDSAEERRPGIWGSCNLLKYNVQWLPGSFPGSWFTNLYSNCNSPHSFVCYTNSCLSKKRHTLQPVSYKRYFRCNNCFLLLVYTIQLSLSTDLVDPPPMGTIYMKHPLSLSTDLVDPTATDGNNLYEKPVISKG